MLIFCFDYSLGMFLGGYYAMGFEALVEVTYPVDQSMGIAVVVAIGYVYVAVFLAMANILGQDLSADAASARVAASRTITCCA